MELEEPRTECGYEISQEVRLDEDGSGDYIPTVNNQQRNQVEKIRLKRISANRQLCPNRKGGI